MRTVARVPNGRRLRLEWELRDDDSARTGGAGDEKAPSERLDAIRETAQLRARVEALREHGGMDPAREFAQLYPARRA